MKYCLMIVLVLGYIASMMACNFSSPKDTIELAEPIVVATDSTAANFKLPAFHDNATFKPLPLSPDEIVAFAKTLIGVPYLYGSSDPSLGLDCSGFITYVFNHFKMEVPRSSIDFTNVGIEVKIRQAVKGDLILFTGTDTLENFVGHMGIVTENTDSLRFIHSTSGKKNGVTITALNSHYLKRYVKVIRIF